MERKEQDRREDNNDEENRINAKKKLERKNRSANICAVWLLRYALSAA